MRSLVLTIIFLISFYSSGMSNGDGHEQSSANEEGITFYSGSWNDALKLAEREGKMIFLDVYASWCGPCKVLKAKTFPDPEAGKFFNKNFINVTLDGEKGDGLKVARKLRVNAYPSLYILNARGEPIVHYAGFLKPEELIQLGEAGLRVNDK